MVFIILLTGTLELPSHRQPDIPLQVGGQHTSTTTPGHSIHVALPPAGDLGPEAPNTSVQSHAAPAHPQSARTVTLPHIVNISTVTVYARPPIAAAAPIQITWTVPLTPLRPQNPTHCRHVPSSAISTPATICRGLDAIDAEPDSDEDDISSPPPRRLRQLHDHRGNIIQRPATGGRPAANDVWTFFWTDSHAKERVCQFCEYVYISYFIITNI